MIKYLKNTEEIKVINEEKRVLIDFYADWCGPCQMLSPILEELSNIDKDLEIIKINVDEQQEIAQQFKIMSIPTLLYFKDGKLIDRKSAYMPLKHLQDFVK